MLTVPTYLDRSQVHGIGLFSEAVIDSGQTVWEFCSLVDLQFSPRAWQNLRHKLSGHSFRNLVTLSYKQKGDIYICLDNGQFMNHCHSHPNVAQAQEGDRMYALRAIEAGEELICDYFAYSDSDDIHCRNLSRSANL